MKTSVEQALAMALVQDKLNTLIISGPTGVGKSFKVRQLLKQWNIPFRTIPVHIQDESLISHINLEKTLAEGQYVEEPGIFDGPVHVFFVDDFHLLRESMRHLILQYVRDVGGTLIGTVNSSEGSLSVSEWEAIDLHVAVENPDEEERLRILRAVTGGEVMASFEYTSESLSEAAQYVLKSEMSDAMLQLCISYMTKAGTVGNTGEFILLAAAVALAGLEHMKYVLPRHVELATLYVLPHRMRQSADDSRNSSNQESQDNDSANQNDADNQETRDDDTQNPEDNNSDANQNDGDNSSDSESQEEDNQVDEGNSDGVDQGETDQEEEQSEYENEQSNDLTETSNDFDSDNINNSIWPEIMAAISQSLSGLRLETIKTADRKARKGSGKRLRTKTGDNGGHYVRAIQHPEALEDLALDATIRAAAPYQKLRQQLSGKSNKLAVKIERPDYRRKEREKQVGGYYLFVVDASGSMAARKRMEAVKGAIFSLLQDAYEKRDKVGLIVFRKDRAELVLPFTGSIDLARKMLEHLPTGGKTPLAGALELAYNTCEQVLRRSPSEKLDVLIITDGRATFGETDNPVNEALSWGKALATLPIGTLIIDTEQGFIRLGIAKELMQAMHSTYYSLDTITADTVLKVVKGDYSR